MLTIHRSTSLARLADACADVVRTPATADPFAAELLVASGPTHERWLRAHLARRLGVCAHVRVLSPSTLAEEVAERVLGVGQDAARAWRPERLTWRVLGALGARLDTAPFAPVRAWLGADGGMGAGPCLPGSARAVSLARRVAGWFAGYAVSRPALALAWDDGAEPDAWQAVLWRAVRRGVGDEAAHPAVLGAAVAARLREDRPSRDLVPARVVWLAQPGVGRVHVELLTTLAAAGVAVHALLPVAGASVADAAHTHPLRAALGGHAAALDTLLAESARAGGAAVTVDDLDAGGDPRAPGVLAAVRRAVTARGDVAGDTRDVSHEPGVSHGSNPPGPSLVVHACHGPMRQAEVLRDALLALFERDAALRPRDVLVLTPDVALYAPLVEAAFGRGAGAPEIPLRVADRPARLANPVADVALRVLAVAAGRVDAAAVLDLLVAPAIAARWALGGAADARLHAWIEGAGARWGLDGPDRALARALPDRDGAAWDAHGWRFALERLLLGWGLPDDGGAGFGGAVPWDEVEGQDGEVLGRLAEVCRRLFAAVRAVRVARPLAAWCAVLQAHADALVWDPNGDDDDPALVVARRAFAHALDALCEDAAGCDVVLEPAAVRALLEARFAEPAGGGADAGAVTLAALGPGRVRPARVIALVGLDDATFPRRRSGDALDSRGVTDDAPDPGGEDRQAVLDALLAAESQLLVTYTGRSARTNEPFPPATPVALLIEAARAACGADVRHEHALAPFSPRAYGQSRRAAPAFLTRAVPDGAEADALRPLSLDALADALGHPARALVARTLGVWLGSAGAAVAVDEPLELDALQHHSVRAEVLAALDGGRGAARDAEGALFERLRAKGLLPHGPLGRLAYDAAHEEAALVWHAARGHRAGARRGAVRVDQVAGGRPLVGTAGPCWDEGLVALHGGTARAKHLVDTWVRHLALHAADGFATPTSRLVAFGAKEKGRRTVEVHTFRPMPNAAEVLADLVALYGEATRRALPLLPASAREYAKAYANATNADEAHQKGLSAAARAFDDDYNAFSESRDDYVGRLHGAADPLGGRFAELALRVWVPLHASLGARMPVAEGTRV